VIPVEADREVVHDERNRSTHLIGLDRTAGAHRRRGARGHVLHARDPLRPTVLPHLEVVGSEIGDVARAVGDDRIDLHEVHADAYDQAGTRCRRGGGRCRWCRLGHRSVGRRHDHRRDHVRRAVRRRDHRAHRHRRTFERRRSDRRRKPCFVARRGGGLAGDEGLDVRDDIQNGGPRHRLHGRKRRDDRSRDHHGGSKGAR
jgi:hypothetical protein